MAAEEKLDLNYIGIPEVQPEDIPEHIRESGINPKLLNLAAHFGLVYWGWTVRDYMAQAIKTMGYETIHNWGVQGCLDFSEQILTSEGIMQIGEIYLRKESTYVLSDNQGKLEYNLANPLFTGIKQVYRIKTTRGIIEATEEHPFLTSRGWKTTLELSVGEKLKCLSWVPPNNSGRSDDQAGSESHYEEAVVLSVLPSAIVPVYNLEVANTHNFFLANGILAHNCKKSNLTLQQGSWCYGERVGDRWYEDWDRVLKYLVFRPGKDERGFLKLVKSINMGERIAWAGWDDMGVHYPSTVWRTDMPKYQAIDAAWAIIRTKISVISTNNPLIDRVAKNIKDNISMEVFVGRNQMLMTERFCHIPGLKAIEAFFFKVPIEKPYQFDYERVPADVWKEYWDIRLAVAESAIQKLDEAYSDEMGDVSDYTPVYDLVDQNIASPSQILSYSTRGLIHMTQMGGKGYVLTEDVEHILKHCTRPRPQKASE